MTGVKFSQFDNGGDLEDGDIIVGLRDGVNTKFNAPSDPSDIYLLKANNLRDVNNADEAFSNLGTGTGEVLIIDDSDFFAGFLQLPIPYPNYVVATITTPGLQLRLPVANVDYDSPSIGQGVIVKCVNSSEVLDIGTAPLGDSISSLTGNEASFFILQNNSTPSGVWHEEPYVYQVNDQTGNVILTGNDIDADLTEPPVNYVPINDTIDGHLIGIDNALGGSGPNSQDLQDAYDTGENATVELADNRPLVFQAVAPQAPSNAIVTPTADIYLSPNFCVFGWTFTPQADMLITALQYDDALITSSASRNTGIYVKATRELLGSIQISNADPLDATTLFRTATLNSPIQVEVGTEYVYATVVPAGQNYRGNILTCTPSADITITESAILPESPTGVSLTYPSLFASQNNAVAVGSFEYTLITIEDSVNINDSATNASTLFSVDSKTRASIPAPVMSGAERDAIAAPETGAQVYVSDSSPPSIYIWDGSAWVAASNPTLGQGQLIMGVDSSTPVAGDLISSDNSIIINTSVDGEIDLTAGAAALESLQDAYEVGNTIELGQGRALQFFSQSTQTAVEAVTSPSSGLSSTANYAIQGWVFIPDVAISVTALQYLDANLPSGIRDVGIYQKSSGALLVSTKVAKTDPLVGFYRTNTLDVPLTLIGGEEYVICVVVYPSENYNLNNDAVTAANISATQRCTGAISINPIPLSFPTNFIAAPNITPEGYFLYEVIVPSASIEFCAGEDATSYMMRAVSTTLGNIPLPVMTTNQFRAIPSKAVGLMAFSSDEFRPLAYNGIGANQLIAYISDVGIQAEGGSYGLSLDVGNTSDATSINVVYSAYQRIQNRVNVSLRLTFVPTAIDPVISFYTLFNLVNFANDEQASGFGNLWLSVNPTGLDGSAQIHSIPGASSIEIAMITPDFNSIKAYELNATYSYVIDPAGLLNPFITVWDTEAATPAAATVELPLVSTGTYDFIVDWGDGNFDRIQVWNAGAVTHVYDTAGVYTVKIYGTCEGWNFGVSSVDPLIIDVLQWGIVILDDGTASDGYFADCEYMEIISASDAPDLSGSTSLVEAFLDCTLLTRIVAIGSWDVATITDATDMFGGVTLDTDNYNELLIGWSDQVVQNGVTFSGGNSEYSGDGVAARAVLTGTYTWTITDGGPA